MNQYKIPFKKWDSIVDIGGGTNPFKADGITVFNVDKRQIPGVDAVRNLEEDFTDIGVFDGLVCTYVAEHVGWRKIKQFFNNCYKVLKDGGVAVFTVPNTVEQMRKVLSQPKITLADSEFLFGGQDFPDNIHKVMFSKDFITELLQEAGFSDISIYDHPNPDARDMYVEAYKQVAIVEPEKTKKTVKEMYGRAYFEDDGDGYVGFWDFPVHFNTVNAVLDMKPESVLDVGAARGYIVKHLEARGIRSVAMDVSEHCYHTRATNSFVLHDATKAPWPFKDNEFDLVISTSFLEHIPEGQLPTVMREMARVSKRSLHEVTFEITPQDIDTTHHQGTIKPHEWWINKFGEVVPEYPVKIMSSEEMEKVKNAPVHLPDDDGTLKVNFGSHICMFYYGWLNTDIIDLAQFATQTGRRFQQMDVLKPSTLQPNSVDLATAHHLIEHFDGVETLMFLKSCLLSLKPGGILRLSAPDAQKISEVYSKGKIKETYGVVNVGVEKAQTENEAFYKLLWEGHKMIVDEEYLMVLMKEAGFVNVEATPFNTSRSETIRLQTIDSFPTLSVYVEGEKALDKIASVRGPVITVEPELESYQKYLQDVDA